MDEALAVDRTRILMGCYRKADIGDTEIYTMAIISVLIRYPESIAIAVTEPATGIPSRLKWLPAIAEVVEACDELMAPILRQQKRDQLIADQRAALPPPAYVPKQQVDDMLAKAHLKRMPTVSAETKPDGNHMARAMADMVARRKQSGE